MSAKAAGFSLLELLLALVVLALALSLITVLGYRASQQGADPLLQIKAAELAQAYLDEIQARGFDEQSPPGNLLPCDRSGRPACTSAASFGADSGETRASFDDVDDYHGLNEAPTQPEGTALAGYTGFRVQIQVSYAGTDLGLSLRSLKRVQLQVVLPDGAISAFAFYKGNF